MKAFRLKTIRSFPLFFLVITNSKVGNLFLPVLVGIGTVSSGELIIAFAEAKESSGGRLYI